MIVTSRSSSPVEYYPIGTILDCNGSIYEIVGYYDDGEMRIIANCLNPHIDAHIRRQYLSLEGTRELVAKRRWFATIPLRIRL